MATDYFVAASECHLMPALDEVAYLRFASVYRAFESADDFESAIAQLRSRAPEDVPLDAVTAST